MTPSPGSAARGSPGPSPGPSPSPELVETQVARTELAWVRTALACAGLAALAAHLAGDGVGPVVVLGLAATVALPGLVAAWWRIRRLGATPYPEAPAVVGVALLAGSVAVVDLAVLVLLAR